MSRIDDHIWSGSTDGLNDAPVVIRILYPCESTPSSSTNESRVAFIAGIANQDLLWIGKMNDPSDSSFLDCSSHSVLSHRTCVLSVVSPTKEIHQKAGRGPNWACVLGTVIQLHSPSPSIGVSSSSQFLGPAFLTSLVLCSSLNHVNIVRLLEVILTSSHLLIKLEYAAGGELHGMGSAHA